MIKKKKGFLNIVDQSDKALFIFALSLIHMLGFHIPTKEINMVKYMCSVNNKI